MSKSNNPKIKDFEHANIIENSTNFKVDTNSLDNANIDEKDNVEKNIDKLVTNARQAYSDFLLYNQEKIDIIVKKMTIAALAKHRELAKMAVEETGMGVYEDKITKNIFASEYVYNSIKNLKTVGVINENDDEDYMEVAEPIGVIAGVTPTTNPTSTTILAFIQELKSAVLRQQRSLELLR